MLPNGMDASAPSAASVAARMYRVEASGVQVEIPFEVAPMVATNKLPPATLSGAVLLRPRGPLAPGTRVVIEADAPDCAKSRVLRAEYLITEPAPLPTQLGTLNATVMQGWLTLPNSQGQCTTTLDVPYAQLGLALSPEARPFADLLSYRLLVDGETPWPRFLSRSDAGIVDRRIGLPVALDEARVHGFCDMRGRVAEPTWWADVGVRRASLRGELPDGTVIVSSEAEFELRCETGGTAPSDAGVVPTATSVDSATEAEELSDEAGGCSLSGRAEGRDTTSLWSLALLWSALYRTARRRKSGPCSRS
jgi:hypothetical protein